MPARHSIAGDQPCLFAIVCRGCKQEKDATDFGIKNGKRLRRCKACIVIVNSVQRDKRRKNGKALAYSRRPHRAAKLRAGAFKNRNGITYPDFQAMHAAQEGLCAICRRAEATKGKYGVPRTLAVDHCHKTGKVRELLCFRCNQLLGYSLDNIQTLRNAVDYLERHAGS